MNNQAIITLILQYFWEFFHSGIILHSSNLEQFNGTSHIILKSVTAAQGVLTSVFLDSFTIIII